MESLILDGLAVAFVALQEASTLIAIGIFLSCMDDFFIDIVYLLRCACRTVAVYSRHSRTTSDALQNADPDAIAILVPAWQEANVIGAMLGYLVDCLDYPRYRIFVGTYPNDPATYAAVQQVNDPRIQHIITPRDGPTTKGDCLNALWRALVAYEAVNGIRFKAVAFHDAEDVAHPHELSVFDHLIPRLTMVQLPVRPLPNPTSRWIAGHYMDEFAENHGKDIVVREALGAAVPSAGVACAIDRELLGQIADIRGGAPFDLACVTEDYELGLHIHALGGRTALVRIPGRHGQVVTRENFPATLDEAVKQKSRWLLGITLQGWDRIGWQGGLANRYMLLRDRKALVAIPLAMLAYLVLAGLGLAEITRAFYPLAHRLPPIVEPGSWLAILLLGNATMLSWRLTMRAAFTGAAYGPIEAILSVPRAFIGNVVNFLAALRATRRYLRIQLGYEKLSWDKTAHHFPTALTRS